jgi:hypothetical protein
MKRAAATIGLAITLFACGGGSASSSTFVVVSGGASSPVIAGEPAGGGDAGEPSGPCGRERWAVKTGTDADAGLVNPSSATPTTIANLRIVTPPGVLPADSRIKPTETTVFTINATLTEYKLETDSDIHLVISDASGLTMIAEIPAPHCVGRSSPFASLIATSRAMFDSKYSPQTDFTKVSVLVKLKGVGFFDTLHGQTGVAPNGIELHPVLDLSFG